MLCCGVAVFAPSADAFIYFSELNGFQTIGRATLAGSAVDGDFVRGGRHPCGVAVDSRHLYWANSSGTTDAGSPGGTIGRSDLDGTGVDQSFITGPEEPCGVAVDTAHIYWANRGIRASGVAPGTTIGRANVDGSAVTNTFITGANLPCGVAVDSAHVYWANAGGDSIGRANLDGTGAISDFITGADAPCGVAVDTGHIYWTNTGNGFSGLFSGTTIGRANLDGTAIDQNFIRGVGPGPFGVTVDSGHIYWSEFQTSIGRANLDGGDVDSNFVPHAANVTGLAIDADPATLFTLSPFDVDPARGTATVVADLVGPGTVVLSGPKVERFTRVAGKRPSNEVTLGVIPTAAARRRLAERGRLKVNLRITYTPSNGEPVSRDRELTLRRR
jgi:hypothetical protein